MAPKSSFLSQQPSKDKNESEESSSEEEDDGREESGPQSSETDSSDDETEAVSSFDKPQNRPTLENLNSPIPAPKFDPRSASDTDSDGSPSSYVMQPITKASVSSSKRSRGEIEGDSLSSFKSLRAEEKKSVSTPAGGGGVGCINRLWSNEDEIAVLNGMIEFKIAKGSGPSADMGAFYSFIKGKLKVDFSRDQLRSKITRMKKRFLNALKKGDKGSDPVFSKPHEDMAFVLSKKIWGKSVDVKKKLDEDVVVERGGDGEGGDFWSKYPNINASFDNMKASFPSLVAPVAGMSLLKERLSLIGNVKAKELDDKWKQLLVEKTELDYKILILMKEQVQMALDQ
ncbi:STOREKEEPER protein-like [Salvia hispanica]|uniref:STOREKEEPER protein-like n=1 Tax=Salvia hispanica TaxID=49212 RepID=UPI0020097807|nr:STOREKEEPER protein-like [Salvia hispanica]XP_047945051.1 STOREKEEPER protein-like [Salvia hispanica]